MIEKIRKWFYPMLTQHDTFSDDDLYIYLLLLTAIMFSAFLHILLLAIFLYLAIQVFVLANILSLTIYYVCYLQTKKKNYALSGILLSAEVFLYTYLSIYFLGCEYYIIFLFIVILIMQIIIPYTHTKIRVSFILLAWLSIIISVFQADGYTPIYNMQNQRVLLSLAFTQIGISAIIIEILIGNFIKKLIADYRNKQIKELENLAHTDSLTGLYNRRYATLVFKNLDQTPPVKNWCIAILDIDNFKQINDKMGHNAGDEILVHLSGLMRSSLRKHDIIFRWGGEEFLILLSDVEIDIAQTILDKLRQKIAETPLIYHEKTIVLTATIGVHPLNNHDIWESIEQCDQKLYHGKTHGKNIVISKK